MGKRRTCPLPGDRKFHAPKAKRILQGAVSSAVPVPSRNGDPDGDPAGVDAQARSNPMRFAGSKSKDSGGKVDPERILVGGHGFGSPQEGKDKEIGGSGALGSPKQSISSGMEENHLELPQLGILEVTGTEILEGTGNDELESSKPRVLEGTGNDELESSKPRVLDGAGENCPESPKPVISEEDGAADEQVEAPTHGILDRAGEEYPESVNTGIPESDEAREEQLKQGIWDGAGENQLESPRQGESGAHGSSPEHVVMDMAPVESSKVPDAAGQGEGDALKEGCGAGIALSMDTGTLDCPRDPQSDGGDTESGNSDMATPGLDPAATSTEPQDHWVGTSPELPAEKQFPDAAEPQPQDTTGWIHTGSTGNSPAQPWESSARATEPADASDVIRGLIRELSDLNRLAMGAHRGLELLRRPKPRRGRRPVPSGSHWKEG